MGRQPGVTLHDTYAQITREAEEHVAQPAPVAQQPAAPAAEAEPGDGDANGSSSEYSSAESTSSFSSETSSVSSLRAVDNPLYRHTTAAELHAIGSMSSSSSSGQKWDGSKGKPAFNFILQRRLDVGKDRDRREHKHIVLDARRVIADCLLHVEQHSPAWLMIQQLQPAFNVLGAQAVLGWYPPAALPLAVVDMLRQEYGDIPNMQQLIDAELQEDLVQAASAGSGS